MAASKPTYDALLKDELDNLGSDAARAVSHKVFVEHHGLYVRGLQLCASTETCSQDLEGPRAE